jgi:tetratricopeptide (TPR) repeat protein
VRRNQHDSAVISLSKALEMDSTQYTSFANRAVAFGALGKPDESIADFKRYLKYKPEDERVIFSIGMIYYNMGDMQESIGWFNRAIAIKPDLANYHWMRSQAYRQSGNRPGALKDAVKAQELGMALPEGYTQTLK